MNHSQQKGKKFERDIAEYFSNLLGTSVRRTPSSGALIGGSNQLKTADLRSDAREILAGDLILPKNFVFHVEIKHYHDTPKLHKLLYGEDKDFDRWIRQAEFDAKPLSLIPLVVFKIDRKGVFVAMPWRECIFGYDSESCFPFHFHIFPHPVLRYKDYSLFSLNGFSEYYDRCQMLDEYYARCNQTDMDDIFSNDTSTFDHGWLDIAVLDAEQENREG